MQEPLIFEIDPSREESPYLKAKDELENQNPKIPRKFLNEDPIALPELSEIDIIRHFMNLSRKNFGVDFGFYPLGSCTMKYNPKINEDAASLSNFTNLHPYQSEEMCQGTLEILYNLETYLCAIFGFDSFTLEPLAGAHGELTGLLIAKAYFKSLKQWKRDKIIVPDSSHGTNPSSAALASFQVIQIKSNPRGGIDIEDLKRVLGSDTAMVMLTNPNTLGLFEENILEIAKLIHDAGALFYMDGANANAIMGKVKPTDLGFDIAHINLHKTFSTPHGGGGPGSGPVGVVKKLTKFLPIPRIVKIDKGYRIESEEYSQSIGKVSSFYGNVGVIIKAYSYIRSIGSIGLKDVSEHAVLNANYMMNKLKKYYYLPYDRTCQHEFVISAKWQKEKYGVKALDIAKRLIDFGFHPPTIYFPLIVEEAIMIEPTETESKKTLDSFIEALIQIAHECETDPEKVKHAPYSTPVSRLDEVKAVKDLDICYKS